MEEAKDVVKHILLAKFKDEISPNQVNELIKGYADLVNRIEPMKSFQCYNLLTTLFNQGKDILRNIRVNRIKCLSFCDIEDLNSVDVSSENLHQGFTHVFESTFESTEGVAEYVAHPVHLEFANVFIPALEKVIVIDYKPTIVRL